MPESIYGAHKDTLPKILDGLVSKIKAFSDDYKEKTGEAAYEHLIYRVKSEESMREKCRRKGLPETARSALVDIHDAIGIRIVCCFLNDVYDNIEFISSLPDVEIVNRKDYIRNSKPSGYRSYHLILRLTAPFEDEEGNNPGKFYVEVQLRTIAQDSWASLEHQMKYKKDIKNPEMITRELKRCADELASCDLSMQTIRNLIRQEH
ncbi:GTP pyrophosphokinase family protein [uncultured Dialister sp.]|uniref:GTP pyrophosphokinase n=1 Tax=uncultured Dialister sp. TaxID=278064 RepID=UPI0025D6DEF4|nr:GTP pyrophosphokinase family protein [uncultured Dialister sp.]